MPVFRASFLRFAVDIGCGYAIFGINVICVVAKQLKSVGQSMNTELIRPRAILLDFYGTVVEEDDEFRETMEYAMFD